MSNIVRLPAGNAKPMSAEDACSQLESSNREFVVYRDAKTNVVCVMYRRRDGHFGLIETGAN
jgi:putative sigma-54 modulation protein